MKHMQVRYVLKLEELNKFLCFLEKNIEKNYGSVREEDESKTRKNREIREF